MHPQDSVDPDQTALSPFAQTPFEESSNFQCLIQCLANDCNALKLMLDPHINLAFIVSFDAMTCLFSFGAMTFLFSHAALTFVFSFDAVAFLFLFDATTFSFSFAPLTLILSFHLLL